MIKASLLGQVGLIANVKLHFCWLILIDVDQSWSYGAREQHDQDWSI